VVVAAVAPDEEVEVTVEVVEVVGGVRRPGPEHC
jgi:hypothetical protein